MKTTVLALLFFFSVTCNAQNDKFIFSLGANWSPTVKINTQDEFKIVLPSYSPQLEIVGGVKGLDFFVRLGNVMNLGFRAGNKFLMGGLSYSYSPYSMETYKHAVYLELYYHRKIFKNVYLLLYTKHGVTLEASKYIFSPVNIGLNFRLN